MPKLDKNLFIRADVGTKIGTGHIMRCLTLAESLKKKFVDIYFISNKIPQNLADFIERKGYKVCNIHGYSYIEGKKIHPAVKKKSIERDVNQSVEIISSHKNEENWLIIDHYGIDKKWEEKIRKYVDKIIVIDDLANRKHDCNVLIDQNFYKNMKVRYEKLVPKNCMQLVGPKYALLRSEFKNARKKLKRKNRLCRIFVSFGGSDPTNQTAKVLLALKNLNLKCRIDAVVGNSNPHKDYVKRLCASIPFCLFHNKSENIASLMANADLAIGGGGSMTWERCCIGLPTIVSILSNNQQKLTEEVAEMGCVINLGYASKLTSNSFANALKKIEIKTLQKMSEKCLRLVDGNGTRRIVNKIFQIGIK